MIEIKGIKAYGFHGVFANEREIGQEFVVDVVANLDISQAAKSDELNDSVDYGAIAKIVEAQIKGEPFNLIEKLAGRIGEELIAQFKKLDSVTIKVHKPSAPLGVPFTDVAVTVTTKR